MHLYNNIPSMLKERPNWVAWGIRDAPPKSPFHPASLLSGKPFPAKAGVRETWSSYEAAVECVRRGLARGIGYEFDGSVYGVDLDHVIDEAGTVTPQAQEIVGKLGSYTEVSPSGTGLHIFVLAPGADITRHRKKDYFLEIYSVGRYFTVTGNVMDGLKPIAPAQPNCRPSTINSCCPTRSKGLSGSLLPTLFRAQHRNGSCIPGWSAIRSFGCFGTASGVTATKAPMILRL